VFNTPADPLLLWECHKDSLTEDYLFKKRQMLNDPTAEPDEQVYDCGILDIEDSLQNFGFTLTKITGFVLPSLDIRNTYTRLLTDEQNRHPRIIREHLLLNALTSLEPLQKLTFNEHQQAVYDNVMNLV
jgi:hypothetical protein